MRSFINKMYICLFEPRKMGLFFGEKMYKSFLHVLLIAFIAVLPFTISLITQDEISNLSYDAIEEWIMEDSLNIDLSINNGVLSGEKSYALLTNEAIIYINPTGEKLNVEIDYVTYHVIEFNKDSVQVSFLDNVISSKTYLEAGISDLDFSKMEDADYVEFDKFISLINVAFNNVRVGWIIINSLLVLFDVYLTVILSALLLAVVIKIFNPLIGFRFRFKAALDAQYISLFFILLMLLFNADFLRYVGIVFSAIYVIRAMMAIIRVEFKKKIFSDKDGEE